MIRVQITDISNKRITEYVALQVALAHNGTRAGLLITRVDKSILEVDITGLRVIFTPQAEGKNHNASNMHRRNSWRGQDYVRPGAIPDVTESGYDDVAPESDGDDEL
jgi:hypothetical protein